MLHNGFFIPLVVTLLVYTFKNIVFNDALCTIISIVILILSTVFSIYYKKLKIKLKKLSDVKNTNIKKYCMCVLKNRGK